MSEQWFSYEPIDGVFKFHATEAEARRECEENVDFHREIAGDDGWDENAGDVCWGRICQRLTETSRRAADPESDPMPNRIDDIVFVEMDLRPEHPEATT